MTTYVYNFSSDVVDTLPSGWTPRWEDGTATWAIKSDTQAEGDKVLQVTPTANGSHFISHDPIDNQADVEILTRFKLNNVNLYQLYLFARVNVANNTGYWVRLSDNLSNINVSITKKVAGLGPYDIGGGYIYPLIPYDAGVWNWIRFRVVGSTISLKVWKDGVPEPNIWNYSITDTDVPSGGLSGLGHQQGGATEFDYVSFATQGDVAPLLISSTTVERAYQAVVETSYTQVGAARIHQAIAESAYSQQGTARLHQTVVEAAIGSVVPAYVHQAVVEVLYVYDPGISSQPQIMIIC